MAAPGSGQGGRPPLPYQNQGYNPPQNMAS